MNWNHITELSSLELITEESFTHTIVIYKHSTRCGVSKIVLKKFEKSLSDDIKDNTGFYFLDLIAYRDISNAIAQRWDLPHQSPQLLVIESGSLINSASHFAIESSLISS